MEAVGAAASVVALVELAAKIGSACVQYSCAVKNAAKNISRLQKEAKSLQDLLQQVKKLLDGPDAIRLAASGELKDGIDTCGSELQSLNQRLSPSKTRKLMSRANIQALKWPFETAEVDKFLRQLERCKQSISIALQVNQTHLTLALHQKLDLEKLPLAEGAQFNSYSDELDARCHPDTRIELRNQIEQWASEPQGKSIFWLCGIAGTGKSTISRTVAQSFADKGELAASFFFKRGGGDRGNARRFFTTLARQMVVNIPAMSSMVSQAIEADSTLAEKSLKDQFQKIILQPLSRLDDPQNPLRRVLVIDALDECDREEDIKNILDLLPQVPNTASISVRIFVTSRPELPVLFGFDEIKESGHRYQDIILQEIPRPIIEHDIEAFLKDEFAKIQGKYDRLHPEQPLGSSWPGGTNLKILVDMAIPLFIFAVTVCRFVGDRRWDPDEQLQIVLKRQTASQASKLDQTYCPILDRLLLNLSVTEAETLIGQFKLVVGSLILLASPLSCCSLADLLGVSESTVRCRLDSLHSVLSLPSDRHNSVRLFHLSFREFLVDPEKKGKNTFWIDEKETHENLVKRCLASMSHSLKENICGLKGPRMLRAHLSTQEISRSIPAEVDYACQYWIHHLEGSGIRIADGNSIYDFLVKHFLHWLEALSLTGRLQEGATMLTSLEACLVPNSSNQIASLIFDGKRFLTKNQASIDSAPLQLYSSALMFSLRTSIVRSLFKDKMPPWVRGLPNVKSTWSAEMRALEGHTHTVTAVAFSDNNKLLASTSYDKTVRLWDPATGITVQTLEGHINRVIAVAFSHDSKLLASASYDNIVRL